MQPDQQIPPQPQPNSPPQPLQQPQPMDSQQTNPQPPIPDGTPQSQPTQPQPQPAVQPIATQPQQVSGPSQQPMSAGSAAMKFSSNPFRAVGKGIGDLLAINPQSGLTITLMYLFVAVPYVVGLALAFIVGNPILALMAGLLTLIFAIIVGLRVYVGSIYLFSKSNAKQEVTAKQAFKEGATGHLASIFFGSIVAGILVFFGLFLFIIPGIILVARLSLFPFAAVEEGLGPIKSIKRSMQLTKGHTMEMLGVIVVGSFVSGNGLISPVASAAGSANRYYELKAFEAEGQPTGKKSSVNALVVFLVILLGIPYAIFTGIVLNANESNNSPATNEFFLNLEEQDSDFFGEDYLVN